MSKNRFAEFNLDPALAEAAESASDEELIEGIIRLDDPNQVPSQFHVVSQFTRICTGRFLPRDTWAIRQHPTVVSLKAARPLGIFENNDSTESAESGTANGRAVWPSPFTGRGCIVAALDFGLDFGHPNFRNADGTTRVVSFWHQGAVYDPTKPNRYGYGRVFSPDEINQALLAPNPYEALGYHPAISDTGSGSHGTHTLDIAAGNGRALGSHSGIAPEADLMFVHLSTPRLGVVGDLGDSVRMLEALDFVHRTAGNRPCVVNISVGREAGSHDATSPFEQAMHELLRMEPGTNRAICQSAGNYGSAHLAVNGWLRDGEQRDLQWMVHPTDINPEIDAWYSGNDRFSIVLLPPDDSDPVEVSLGEVADIKRDGNLIGRIYHRKNDPNNRDNHVEAFLYRGAPAGVWILRLIGEYVITGRFHAWIERAVPGAQSSFDPKITSRRYTLGTIANSPLVITVGAYDANADGDPLAHFSSCGPTRDERQDKPELLAPGVSVVAARSIPRDAARQEGLLIARSGTSMATPHVTGLVAAMFEAAGRPVSIGEIRDCLKQSADPVTNAEHPNCCAWGRLNVEEAIRRIRVENTAATNQVQAPISDNWFMQPESHDSDEAAIDIAGESREEDRIPVDQEETDVSQSADFVSRAHKGVIMNYELTDGFLDRAEQAVRSSYGGRYESEVFFLSKLLRELDAGVSVPGMSPAALFRPFLYEKESISDLGNVLEILGIPLQRPKDALRPGDWIVRVMQGTGDVGHVSVLASEMLWQSRLASQGIPAEGEYSGHYGIVIEAGAFPHSRSQPFARRVLDSRGRVPQHTLILRPKGGSTAELLPDELSEDSSSTGIVHIPSDPSDSPRAGESDLQRIRRQVNTTMRLFANIVADADAEGYERVVLTIENNGAEIIPGFRKEQQSQPRSSGQTSAYRVRDLLGLYVNVITSGPGRWQFIFTRQGPSISFSRFERLPEAVPGRAEKDELRELGIPNRREIYAQIFQETDRQLREAGVMVAGFGIEQLVLWVAGGVLFRAVGLIGRAAFPRILALVARGTPAVLGRALEVLSASEKSELTVLLRRVESGALDVAERTRLQSLLSRVEAALPSTLTRASTVLEGIRLPRVTSVTSSRAAFDNELLRRAAQIRATQAGLTLEAFTEYNVAVARVRTGSGEIIYLEAGNLPGGAHSEEYILGQLRERALGLGPGARVEQLYSERIPCSNCSDVINRFFGEGTEIYYTVGNQPNRGRLLMEAYGLSPD